MGDAVLAQNDVGKGHRHTRALAMFAVAVAFLAVFAAFLPHGGLAEAVSRRLIGHPVILTFLFSLWLAIIVEGVLGYLAAPDKPKNAIYRLILVALAPPFRMVISPSYPNTKVWVPKLGWLWTGKAAVADMEHRTALPMLLMTALIVPVIAADFLIGPRPHDVLAADIETVTRYDVSDNGMRLFMMDENERVVANVARPDREIRQGLEGNWVVLGRPEGAETSTLSFGAEDAFTLRTGCAMTEGRFAYGYGALGFDGVAKVKSCPPSVLEILIWFTTALIWFSFAFEFILMVSLADKKLAFCKKNWINIVIILLPLLAFLRSLQLFRFLRMAKAGKLMRAYRLRGLLTRVVKLAVVFNLIERMLSRNPDKYGAHLRDKIVEKEEELAELNRKLVESEQTD